jgi:hypothetical protein
VTVQRSFGDLRRFAFEHPMAKVPREIVPEDDYFLDLTKQGLRLGLTLNR